MTPQRSKFFKELLLEKRQSVMKIEHLRRIDEAVRRIENGTFGLCAICGKDILRERLEAVPHTRYCVPCKLHLKD